MHVAFIVGPCDVPVQENILIGFELDLQLLCAAPMVNLQPVVGRLSGGSIGNL